jgi:altronate hydrolase
MTPPSAPPTIRIHPADNVVIARRQLLGGTALADEGGLTVAGLVPPGHKLATAAMAAGEAVRRYNQVIGHATQAIAPGQHVHTHNLAFASFARTHDIGAGALPTVQVPDPATFLGIVRPDGRVATRNYIGVLTSVNCSATAARAIADHFRRDIRPEALADYPNVDGVVALTHGMGCATDSEGEELRVLRRTLGGYARHANFAAVLVVGLGCETNQIQGLIAQEGLQEGAKLQAFSIQDTGGTARTVARGVELIQAMLPEANRVQRQPVPASHLVVGLQCGGSRRLQRHQRQPGAGGGGGPAGAPRRHRHPQRDARDLRRRAPADPPRRQPRGC